MFITFEGVDFCGKTTQIKLIYNWLTQKEDQCCYITKEPGDYDNVPNSIRNQLRSILLDKHPLDEDIAFDLFMVDRALNVRTIKTKLQEKTIVLCDRFIDSTIVYQCMYNDISYDRLNVYCALLDINIVPDMTFLIDIDMETLQDRMNARDLPTDRYESQGMAFFVGIRNKYLQLQQSEPERIILIDGKQSIELVFNQIKEYISNLLGITNKRV